MSKTHRHPTRPPGNRRHIPCVRCCPGYNCRKQHERSERMSEPQTAQPGTCMVEYAEWGNRQGGRAERPVPIESTVTLYVNGQALVGLTCTPVLLEELVLGFLFNEGMIESTKDVAVLEQRAEVRCLDVWLERQVELPQLRFITSGCAGGTTFRDLASAHQRVESDLRITPAFVKSIISQQLPRHADIYRAAGGVHAAGLADGERLLCVAEDV
ncbi:MAG: hypothetical protein E3J64_05125, partial [Anaerolineales bacterium]